MADHTQPVLTIDELTLRPWTVADVPAVVAAYADPLIRQWHMRTMTPGEAEEWVIRAGQDWTEESAASWAITTVSGELVGRMTLGAIDLGSAAADVRYWVVPPARGRRVAGRALTAVTDWGITDLGLHRIELEHSTKNVPSCRVAEGAGYALEGTRRRQLRHEDGWHDMHLHAYLSQDEPH